ncbi:hypothetical protein [Flavobacterium sp. N1719]|uniref:hypothetical protein n=1 Tax=Flavobacterium sp. N1719 TaxID=2885633 RepID=UPI002223CF65|nr:hypothetical protein [Flavobacterium sp. N1719]
MRIRIGYLLFLYSCITWAQTLPKVDFITLNATVLPNFEKKDVNGHCHFVFKVNAPTDTIRIDAKAMRFSGMLINGKAVEYKNNGKELLLYTGFKKGKTNWILTIMPNPNRRCITLERLKIIRFGPKAKGVIPAIGCPVLMM